MYNIKEDLEQMKNYLTNMYIAFNNLNSENANTNRDSDLQDDILKQLNTDKIFLNSLRNNALSIFDKCNRLMMIDSNNINI